MHSRRNRPYKAPQPGRFAFCLRLANRVGEVSASAFAAWFEQHPTSRTLQPVVCIRKVQNTVREARVQPTLHEHQLVVSIVQDDIGRARDARFNLNAATFVHLKAQDVPVRSSEFRSSSQ